MSINTMKHKVSGG